MYLTISLSVLPRSVKRKVIKHSLALCRRLRFCTILHWPVSARITHEIRRTRGPTRCMATYYLLMSCHTYCEYMDGNYGDALWWCHALFGIACPRRTPRARGRHGCTARSHRVQYLLKSSTSTNIRTIRIRLIRSFHCPWPDPKNARHQLQPRQDAPWRVIRKRPGLLPMALRSRHFKFTYRSLVRGPMPC